jgi:hypothetical protein
MARFNEILSGRFNRALQKYLSMKGGPPAAQLASEITPQFQFNSMGADFRYLEGWNRFGFATTIAAAAAISGTLRFRNPATSNVVAVLEKASVGAQAAAGAQIIGMVLTNADLVVIASGINNRLDVRQQSGGSNIAISASDATHPGSGITTLIGTVPAQTMYEFVTTDDQEIAVLPGQAVDLQSSTVNAQVQVSVMWRERFLEDSERT